MQTHTLTQPDIGLDELAAAIGARIAVGAATTTVRGISHDSQTVRAGELWVALPGQRTHGARHLAQASLRHPSAVLTDQAGLELIADSEHAAGLPVLLSSTPRHAMALAAALLMGRPTAAMRTVGITGTNGKTTTAFMVEACLRVAGLHVGLIGTVGFLLDGEVLPEVQTTTVTTPEAPDLQRILATMVSRGAQAMTMEVSSHALALQRVDGIVFDVAGFTNLGIDHLDFHHSVAEYFEAKAQLFTAAHTRHAVINIDDEHGRQLRDRVRAAGAVPCTTVSPSGGAADIAVSRVHSRDAGGYDVEFAVAGHTHRATVPLPGLHNVANAALAVGLLAASGCDLATCLPGLADVVVPGRMEPVPLEAPAGMARPPYVVVDFAHTPTAVGAACRALRETAEGPLVVVVGSGGDRDPAKRAPIGAEAAAACDLLVVADDNPRTEDPAAVRRQVLAGAEQAIAAGARARQVLDGGARGDAVRLALALAVDTVGPGERATVAILGKGHEIGQQIGDQVLPYTDAGAVRDGWQALLAERADSAERQGL